MVHTSSAIVLASVALSAVYVSGTPLPKGGLKFSKGLSGAKSLGGSSSHHSSGRNSELHAHLIHGATNIASSAIAAHQATKQSKQEMQMQQMQMQQGQMMGRDLEDDLFQFSRRDFEVINAREPRRKHKHHHHHHHHHAEMPSAGGATGGAAGGATGGATGGEPQGSATPPVAARDFEERDYEEIETREPRRKNKHRHHHHHHAETPSAGGATGGATGGAAGGAAGGATGGEAQGPPTPPVAARDLEERDDYELEERDDEFWARSYGDFDELD